MTNPESFKSIQLTSHADLLKTEKSELGAATIAADFGKSFVQSAAIEPAWNGLGQLVSAGQLPRFSIVNEENALKSNADSWAQKFGSAFGIAADIVLLSKGKKALFGGGPGREALAAMPWQERAISHGYEGMKLGAFYGAVLTPSDPKENLLWGRVANAGSQAVTFGLLNYGAEFLGAAKVLQNLKPGTTAAALRDMSTMGAAGMPAGVAGVVTDSALRGRELKFSTMSNAATDFAVIGFVMAGLNHGIGAMGRPDSHGVTAARHLTDKLGLSRSADTARTQAEFRIVDGKSQFDSFYKTRLNSSATVETSIGVQQKLHGAMSGIFGERFATYGETRPLLLRHGSDFTPAPSLAGSLSLIASCERLPVQLRANDVFPARSASADSSVWLQPTGENTFKLSREKLPLESNGKEAVMLGLPRLSHVDAREIKVGQELAVNEQLKLRRDADGKLWAEANAGSQGIWTRLDPGVEKKINLNDPVYSSDLLIEADKIRAAADSSPGFEKRLESSAVTAILKADGNYYLKGPVSTERIYTKTEPGIPVEVSPISKFIHLGPEGIMPITNHEVHVPKAPPETKPGTEQLSSASAAADAGAEVRALPEQTAATGEKSTSADLLSQKPINRIDLLENPEAPPPVKVRPVLDVNIEDLGAIASRLSGNTVDPKDPSARFGKIGEVVLNTARGGVDAGNGAIFPIYSELDAAMSAGRFSSGIFKRRLQTDPQDRDSGPRMNTRVDEFQDASGAILYVPVVEIKGAHQGRLVLGKDLQPLGIQNESDLITIYRQDKR